MNFFSFLIKKVSSGRIKEIDLMRKEPLSIQQKQLQRLINRSSECDYLRRYAVASENDFRRVLPVVCYEDFSGEIGRIMRGEGNVVVSEPVQWFSKSSGTTNDKSKYIPITPSSLHGCHFRGGRDVIGIFSHNYPASKAFHGKSLTLGGSHRVVRERSSVIAGDLSAILIQNTPAWFTIRRLPSKKVALEADFQRKIELICRETVSKNITNFAGVPSWNLLLMEKVLDYTGKSNICEVWKDMSLFVHGGISFEPYREQYKKLFPDEQMRYMETYNASEGFFAIADDPSDSAMLLMLDYGIYYEFIPMSSLDDHSTIIPLEGVKTGVNYAIIITTSGGLWRYLIGDTVEFTSVKPYKIRITGRTKQYINAFGEELMVDNAERALARACKQTGSVVSNYTVAPVFMAIGERGCHQWLVEFSTLPDSVENFGEVIDKTLQELNSDYEAKRKANTTLNQPIITIAPEGTFYKWMESRGKIGGQNKVPRLSNDRQTIEKILSTM